jgi:Cupin-like domain
MVDTRLAQLQRTPEWRNVDGATFRDEIIPRDRPAVMRGLAAHWPVVRAATQSSQALYDYMRACDLGQPTETFIAPPDIKGVFFYREDMTGLNFERVRQPFHATMATILAHKDDTNPPAIWAPAASAAGFSDFARQNAIDILSKPVVPRLWVGNAITAPTHYDNSDNVACVAAGRRRFTFFPPDQLPNLYVGPLDLAPGGMPTSMVKVSAPDLERYPNFAKALAVAETAELGPGDAVFIPSYWWHNVESLLPLNLLVNFWWLDSSRGPASPFAALALGLLSITALPPSRREIWRKMFDHYVFQTNGDPVPYLPPDRRGMLGPMNPMLENYMRTQLVRSITNSLPKPLREQIQRWMASAGPSVDSDRPYGND